MIEITNARSSIRGKKETGNSFERKIQYTDFSSVNTPHLQESDVIITLSAAIYISSKEKK